MSQEPPEDLVDRVSALEQQQRADRRALGALDKDVSDLQVQRRQDVRLMQSLRDTQLEHGERLGRVEDRLTGVEGRLTGVEGRLTGVEGRLSGVEGQLTQFKDDVNARLTAMSGQLDVIVGLLDRDAG